MAIIVQKDPVGISLPGGKPAFPLTKKTVSQLLQKRESIVAGFGNAVRGEQTQTAEKLLLRLGAFAHPVC